MNLGWFLRMSRWARNPPSWDRVKLVAGVVVLCVLLVGAEAIWGWPDWLITEGGARPVRP